MTNQLLYIVVVATIFSCNDQKGQSTTAPSTPGSTVTSVADDNSSAVAAIMKADSAWDKASEAKSVEGWLNFYADDAIVMPPGDNISKDKAARETSIKNMFATPGASLRFQTSKVE